jgi:hypothetical protein
MKTLVTYGYFETPQSRLNLEFLAEVGMPPDEQTTYVVVVNGRVCSVPLAERQDRVILRRDNTGFDFGAYRHALAHLSERFGCRVEELPFEHFVFVNSSAAGPFLPAYFPRERHWSSVFTSRLDHRVKLVGPSIACLPPTDAGGYGPRVEGYCFTTDRTGLGILWREETSSGNPGRGARSGSVQTGPDEPPVADSPRRQDFTADPACGHVRGLSNWFLRQLAVHLSHPAVHGAPAGMRQRLPRFKRLQAQQCARRRSAGCPPDRRPRRGPCGNGSRAFPCHTRPNPAGDANARIILRLAKGQVRSDWRISPVPHASTFRDGATQCAGVAWVQGKIGAISRLTCALACNRTGDEVGVQRFRVLQVLPHDGPASTRTLGRHTGRPECADRTQRPS